MLKVISFGTNTPHNRLNIIQRNGKRIVIAITLEIDVISERIDHDLNREAAVNFSVSEIPLEVARKVISDTAKDQPAVVVLEYGKTVKDDVKVKVAVFVAKCFGTIAQ